MPIDPLFAIRCLFCMLPFWSSCFVVHACYVFDVFCVGCPFLGGLFIVWTGYGHGVYCLVILLLVACWLLLCVGVLWRVVACCTVFVMCRFFGGCSFSSLFVVGLLLQVFVSSACLLFLWCGLLFVMWCLSCSESCSVFGDCHVLLCVLMYVDCCYCLLLVVGYCLQFVLCLFFLFMFVCVVVCRLLFVC